MTTLIDVLAKYDEVVRANRSPHWDTLREVSNPEHEWEIRMEFSDIAQDVGFEVNDDDAENLTMTPLMETAIDKLLAALLAVYRLELAAEKETLGRDHFGEVRDDETNDTKDGMLFCPDCDKPTYYDSNDDQYHHASDGAYGCFLIATDPVLKADLDESRAKWLAKYERERQAKAAQNAIDAANAFVQALSTLPPVG